MNPRNLRGIPARTGSTSQHWAFRWITTLVSFPDMMRFIRFEEGNVKGCRSPRAPWLNILKFSRSCLFYAIRYSPLKEFVITYSTRWTVRKIRPFFCETYYYSKFWNPLSNLLCLHLTMCNINIAKLHHTAQQKPTKASCLGILAIKSKWHVIIQNAEKQTKKSVKVS